MAKTSLSAGFILYGLLSADEAVTALTGRIYPVVADEAKLPYVVYGRSKLVQEPAKGGGADMVQVDVLCYAATYEGSVELAEAVRAALDGKQGGEPGFWMRSCHLAGSAEYWSGDAFIQELNFNVRI